MSTHTVTGDRRIGNRRGAILVEGLVVAGILCGALALNVELARRAQIEGMLHLALFLATREVGFGGSETRARRRAGRFVSGTLPETGPGARRLRWELERRPRSLETRLHLRFPALWAFPGKHHFETTLRCRFPF